MIVPSRQNPNKDLWEPKAVLKRETPVLRVDFTVNESISIYLNIDGLIDLLHKFFLSTLCQIFLTFSKSSPWLLSVILLLIISALYSCLDT